MLNRRQFPPKDSPSQPKRRGRFDLSLLVDSVFGASLLGLVIAVYLMDRNDAAIPLPPQVTPVAEEDPVEEAEPDMEALEPELEDVPLPPVPEIIRPEKSAVPIDPIPRIAVHFFGNGRFGVTTSD